MKAKTLAHIPGPVRVSGLSTFTQKSCGGHAQNGAEIGAGTMDEPISQ
jgi:hypothetical protein